MTTEEILKAYPTSQLIELVNPYTRTVRFRRDDEYGEFPCDPPSDHQLRPGWRYEPSEATS